MNTMRSEPEPTRVGDDGATGPRPLGVLVVIGDPRLRAETADDLRREGFQAWAVSSGVEALAVYAEHAGKVDVLLLDAEVGDLPGPAFLERFRKHFPGVPCVFLAGRSGAGASVLAGVGVTVLRRPITPAVLAYRLLEEVAFAAWVIGP